jgi:hypothetical protein
MGERLLIQGGMVLPMDETHTVLDPGAVLVEGREIVAVGPQYLQAVSASVWGTTIGGYAVLPLWLRNRRGRRLTGDEARELARIAVSLAAASTVRIGIEDMVGDVLDGETITT